MMTSGLVTPPGRKNPLHLGMPGRLKRARKAAKLTPTRLSLIAGLSNTAAADLEAGGQVPRIDTVERLARALGMDPCILAFGVEGQRVFRQKIVGGRPADVLPEPGPSNEGPLASVGLASRLNLAAGQLTQRALGEGAGLSHTAIGKLQGGHSVPGLDVVEALAVALGVSPCWLAYGSAQGPSEDRKREP